MLCCSQACEASAGIEEELDKSDALPRYLRGIYKEVLAGQHGRHAWFEGDNLTQARVRLQLPGGCICSLKDQCRNSFA